MDNHNHVNTGTFETANYDFCLFRIPKKCGRVLWQITNVCNYSCGYCIFASGPEKIDGELATNEVLKALDGLKSHDFTHLKFTGGEPFVRKDLVDILQHSCDLGLVVDVSTNASHITQEKSERLASMGLNMVHISVDGHTKAIHEGIRGNKTYDKTIQGLQHLVKQEIYVRVGTVLFTGNDQHLREMVEFCAEQGVNELAFSIMEPAGRIAGDYSLVTRVNRRTLGDQIEALASEYEGSVKVRHNFISSVNPDGEGICPGATKFLYIDNFGRVAPCTWVVEKSPAYQSGLNLKTSSIDEVLGSQPIQGYLGMLEQSRKEGYQRCPLKWKGKEL